MSEPTQITELFTTLAKVLLRCWIFGFLLLLLWFGMFMLAREQVYAMQGAMFELSRHELDVIFYCGMGLIKLAVLLFFLFPWLAIRLVLSRRAN